MQQVPTLFVVPCKRTQQVTALLGPNSVGCSWLTVLRPFAWAFKANAETDATSHNIVSPTMLRVVGTCCVVHANERNNCQHCWQMSKEAMHSHTVLNPCNARAQTFSRGQLAPCKRAQRCCRYALPVTEQ